MRNGKVRSRGVWKENLFPCATQTVHLLERNFVKLHGIPRVGTHFVGNNKTFNRSDRLQINHAILWNACYYLLQCHLKKAQIAGSVNTAANFLLRLEIKVTEKIRLTIQEDI